MVVNSTVYHYDENGGIDTTQIDSDSSYVVISGVRENKIKSLNFEVNPNPSSGVFQISGELLKNADAIVSVYNLSGKEVFSTTLNHSNTIDISDLPKGIYFLELELYGELLRKKIIKE